VAKTSMLRGSVLQVRHCDIIACDEGLMPKRVRDMIRIIEADGWYHVRTTGSHRQYHHLIKRGTVTIAGKESVEVPPKTERSIRRQAGLDKE
jgi:predicted RNA binding protein YcfA (HicA-like mRNA interferase family)